MLPSNALAHKLIAWVGLGVAVVVVAAVADIGGGADATGGGGYKRDTLTH